MYRHCSNVAVKHIELQPNVEIQNVNMNFVGIVLLNGMKIQMPAFIILRNADMAKTKNDFFMKK